MKYWKVPLWWTQVVTEVINWFEINLAAHIQSKYFLNYWGRMEKQFYMKRNIKMASDEIDFYSTKLEISGLL